VGATRAANEAGVAQAKDELFEIGSRQFLLLGYLGQARGAAPVPAGELSHQAHPVLALRGEGNGAGAVVRPGGQLLAPIVPVLGIASLAAWSLAPAIGLAELTYR
jgi:hypothetical protein